MKLTMTRIEAKLKELLANTMWQKAINSNT